ncbi:GNAT family N-acetyltransferase [Priestia megaterium]|uniref:GNAT family N-acetyltransferase n=1 Tax=Priestia megaterium TaxID=1404 RepID=UPI0011A95B84|nr:GNAT family N-acetyltransferase [Priestia megaterium]
MTELNLEQLQYIPIINYVANKSDLDRLTESFESEDVIIDSWLRSLSDAYEHHIYGLVSTTLIMLGDKLIGFYAARVGELEAEDEEVKKLKGETYIPSVELVYFAMHKDYARKGIGTVVIQDLIGDLIGVNSYAAIRYLFCWSVIKIETMSFYKKNGFKMMKKQKNNTRLMRFEIPDARDIVNISEFSDDFPL